MQIALNLIRNSFSILIEILQFMMFVRAILSWVPGLADNAFGDFIYTVTEWLIAPVRYLFDMMGWNRMMMFDLPFLVTFILLSFLGSVL